MKSYLIDQQLNRTVDKVIRMVNPDVMNVKFSFHAIQRRYRILLTIKKGVSIAYYDRITYSIDDMEYHQFINTKTLWVTILKPFLDSMVSVRDLLCLHYSSYYDLVECGNVALWQEKVGEAYKQVIGSDIGNSEDDFVNGVIAHIESIENEWVARLEN